jgi:prolyl-tRNA editing enzyme YbaK/EbsC (Cys-tRNA(Pro) deacylase)
LSSSLDRVKDDADRLGLNIEIVELAAGTRTALDAANAAGCLVDQIVKSIVFRAAENGEHFLFLTAGNNQVDLSKATELAGTKLEKADANSIREATGFAIGGVSPLGHIRPIRSWMDPHLLGFDIIWAAAGTPSHVFSIDPAQLQSAIGCPVAIFTT